MKQDNQPGGRGYYGMTKGPQITDLATLQVGDVILSHSLQFNAENTLRITEKREHPVLALTAVYFNPTTGTRVGREEIGISVYDMRRDGRERYYRPAPPDGIEAPVYLSDAEQELYRREVLACKVAPWHIRTAKVQTLERNITKKFITDPSMLRVAKAVLAEVKPTI